MPRHARSHSATNVYHFITRGTNKKKIFHEENDFNAYKKLLLEYKERFNIQIYHYCLMSNHAHLLVRSDTPHDLSQMAHFVQRRYAYYYCKTYHWAEQVFRKRFISIPVENDAYLLECGRYIERNPIQAHLAKEPDDYPYSSYNHYANSREDCLVTTSPAYLALGYTQSELEASYKCYVRQARQNEVIMDIPF